MAQILTLRLLGKPEILLDDQPLTGFRTNKANALLYYLAVTGRRHERDELAQLLWANEENAKNSLRVALNNLKKMLPDHLDITRQTLSISQEASLHLDIEEFERRTESLAADDTRVNLTRLSEAIQIYRGDFLEDFFVSDARQFEDWLLGEREHWRHVALETMEIVSRIQLQNLAYADAAQMMDRLLTIEPWHEEAHRQYMITLSRMGEFNAALAQYETCRQVIARELDAEPMPETIALYERIQLARQTRLHNLPPDVTPFLGREKELVRINQLLTDPLCRLVTLIGFGGMGKTRLALEAARRANQEQALQFLNGVVFVSLVGVRSVDDVPTTIADALGILLTGQQQPTDELIAYLRNKEMLLVIDNFEHLLDASALVSQILKASNDIKLLVTSRESLNIDAEWRMDLTGLTFPADSNEERAVADLEPISLTKQYSAVQLFVQTATQVRANFVLSRENMYDVFRLCRLVSGMPLAIKLAATWLRAMPCHQIVTEVERNLDILSTRMRDVLPRQRSMRAIFDYTWELLDQEEQDAFVGISVFRGGFSEEAADRVAGASPAMLATLQDRSLIQIEPTSSGIRYSVQELTLQYAIERLHDHPASSEINQRHCTYYLGLLIAQEPALYGPSPEKALIHLKAEIDNIRQAWHWAVSHHRVELIRKSAEPFSTFLEFAGLIQEGVQVFSMAATDLEKKGLQADSAEEQQAYCAILILKAWFIEQRGIYQEAQDVIGAGLELAQQIGDALLLADAHFVYGRILETTGEIEQAVEEQMAAIELYRTDTRKQKLSMALNILGQMYLTAKRPSEALPHHQEALQIDQELDNKRGVAFGLSQIGNVHYYANQLSQSLSYLTQALEQFTEFDYLPGIGKTSNNVGFVHYSLGNYQEALPYLEHSLEVLRQVGDRGAEANTLESLGSVYQEIGELDQARLHYQRALTLMADESDWKLGRAWLLNSLGLLEVKATHYDRAKANLEQSLQLMRELNDENEIAKGIGDLGTLYHHMGQYDQALEYYDRAIEDLRHLGGQYHLAHFLINKADLLLSSKQTPEAQLLLREGIQLAEKVYHNAALERGNELLREFVADGRSQHA
ncbi:tetratricopeptide repeat protein [Chloroflexi bacterium TSY]|nr:tetratricopeptide repeat protein [Chloroflexi bacterium TSY]